ncbi:hypothetical protein YC2023_040037 [Brassica napus]
MRKKTQEKKKRPMSPASSSSDCCSSSMTTAATQKLVYCVSQKFPKILCFTCHKSFHQNIVSLTIATNHFTKKKI